MRSSDGTVTVASAKWAIRLLGAAPSKSDELGAMLAGVNAAPLEHIFGSKYDTKLASTPTEAALLRACRTVDARMLMSVDTWLPAGEPRVNMTTGQS